MVNGEFTIGKYNYNLLVIDVSGGKKDEKNS